MATTQQLQMFLAMPTALRPFLLRAPSRARLRARLRAPSLHMRLFSTSLLRYATPKCPDVAALLVPEFRTSPLAEVKPDDLFSFSSLPSAAPDESLQDGLARLFTRNPAVFAHGGSDFYQLKMNTRVPEVCILGRSNVGKSSFVNALASRQTNGLAFVSSKAGRTRSINTYGFGPAPLVKDLVGQSAKYKGKEDIPTHAFHLVDMPGYGHASLKEWGRNIALYLSRRTSVKGAVVLIDAEVGPKDSDLHLFELLSAAELRTAIVLTKADKVKSGLEGLRGTCVKVWEGIQDIENRHVENNWNWDKEIFVTAVGAKDHVLVSSTVATARLAVARLAGLVTDNRPKPQNDQKWSGKVVSFDDLQIAPSKGTATTRQHASPALPSSNSRASVSGGESTTRVKCPFADLEHASREQSNFTHRATWPHFSTASFSTASLSRPSQLQHARAFHTTAPHSKRSLPPILQPRNEDLQSILDEFTQTLKYTRSPKERLRRQRQARDRQVPVPDQNILKNSERNQAQKLQKRFPEQTQRTKAMQDKRLTEGGYPQRRQADKAAKKKGAQKVSSPDEWPSDINGGRGGKATKGMSEVIDPDTFKSVFLSTSEFDGSKKGSKKQNKNQKKPRNQKQKEPPLDPFEAKFVQRVVSTDASKIRGKSKSSF
ncbi:hypothetical protein F5X99DRAFT_375343 [Biscogniauxia marginata]|nr:hypothetical protein F5X99DRAFT_375343 [Biscogniauxia marginata]